jgi:hypothetical protein
MDPLSITLATLSIATNCWKIGIGIYDTIDKYQAVPETLGLIVEFIATTKGAVIVIKRYLTQRPILDLSPELENIFLRAHKRSL